MSPSLKITQQPEPGSKLLRFRGDVLVISLQLDRPAAGAAGLRTNLGRAAITRREIISAIDEHLPKLGQDWFDLPMVQLDDRVFQLRLPLVDVGHFEAKAFFMPAGKKNPLWAPGPNLAINVEPADTCCDNSIYNAFVRQFGPNKAGGFFDAGLLDRTQALDQAGYVVIPPSGTFRDLIAELDFIIGTLGCRWIQLLPIYPTPTTYGRMGRFGSPYAALSFTAIDPALARFDQKHTPLEQFVELVDAIHSRNAKLLLDIAINHTGWAASLHESHSYWLVRDDEGEIEVPGAWGVRWEDLTKLNYKHQDLWQYMADVFLTWCRRGVDGFRCDAGYMIPHQAWHFIIAKVREQFPDTIFFLEGLGGKIAVTRRLLDTANFNWAYSELFQNYDRQQIEAYLPQALEISTAEGIMVNYAETHDNLRLAARSQTWAKMRTALCALSSSQGAFGFANGVEWYATEKINVHESPSLNWDASTNQVAEIRRLNAILKSHPAFHDQTRIRLLQPAPANVLIIERLHAPSAKRIVVLVNLDDHHSNTARWPQTESDPTGAAWLDLLTDTAVEPQVQGGFLNLDLAPGQVFCLTADPLDRILLAERAEQNCALPQRVIRQQLKAKALEAWQRYNGFGDIGAWDIEQAATLLQENPHAFCRRLNPHSQEARVVDWQWPKDTRREVMLPPDYCLLVKAPHPFRVQVGHNQRIWTCENALPAQDGDYWALLTSIAAPEESLRVTLQMTVHRAQESVHAESALLLLGRSRPRLPAAYEREALADELRVLGSNGRGAMLLLPVEWGARYSRYDAALAANLHPEIPVDRWIMFVNCQMWVVFRDYSQAVNGACLERFVIDRDLHGTWTFRVPTGHGTHMRLHVQPRLVPNCNAVQLVMEREAAREGAGRLPDHEEIELILRPGIENRSFHQITKAYLGPEFNWPPAVSHAPDGFTFRPDGEHTLAVTLAQAAFVPEPEWYYMRYHSEEASRGFDPHFDLFSPGYFKIGLRGGRQVCLNAAVSSAAHGNDDDPGRIRSGRPRPLADSMPADLDWLEVLKAALRQFVVDRSGRKTVIAGYPWFLDWGRDAIIVSRGLIAIGEGKTALEILKLFGQFEQAGTLPNMIEGTHTGNRDTSDAPLWFVVACGDLVGRAGRASVLHEKCGTRTLKQVLQSIGRSYMEGTANGIKMDTETGLIFSPSHFTWMDTNHPAGTPREGYPIEIQALWYAALCILQKLDTKNQPWGRLAKTVKQAIPHHFGKLPEGYLADCLHASGHVPAGQAEADDALRPNQLFAITLGAVDDPERCRRILAACQELLVPGALRSLADKPLARPLEIHYQGRLLSDPHHPYRGRYEGDEDTSRKPAYHNGTAWTWLFPSFCESWATVYGPGARPAARAWLGSAGRLMTQGCIGQIPEILDGDFPHTQRGCPAQAWGVSEILRVASKVAPE